MICPSCKRDVRTNATFCPYCRHLLMPMPKRETMIGSYRAVGYWRDATPIFWIEPLRNAAGTRYLAIRQPHGLDRATLNNLIALKHPHLARVLGQTKSKQGHWYLIIDGIAGEPLDIVQEKLGVPRATRVFEKLLGAMIYLHEQGWVITQKAVHPAGLIGQIENLLSGNSGTDATEYDPIRRFQQAFALDAQDNPTMFDFTIWEPAPLVPAEHAKRIQQDLRLTVGLLYWLHTAGRLTKNLEALRENSGQIEQFLLNVLQEPCASFQELGERFAQIAHTPEPGATIPLTRLPPGTTTRRLPLTQLTSAALTDVGKVREHNEDNYLAQPFDAANGLFIVADGMGGHAAGEDASKIAIDVMYANAATQWTDVRTAQVPEGVREILDAWIKRANENIFAAGQARNIQMGTTLTAALVLNGEVYAANVGDSRTYLFRNGQLYPLTHDHSLVASLVQAGIVKPEEVYTHPQRNEVFRALGNHPQVNADVFNPVPLQAEDRLVLCSDGLWEMVRPPQFEEILRRNLEPHQACHALVSAANKHGGEDNITVIVAQVGSE